MPTFEVSCHHTENSGIVTEAQWVQVGLPRARRERLRGGTDRTIRSPRQMQKAPNKRWQRTSVRGALPPWRARRLAILGSAHLCRWLSSLDMFRDREITVYWVVRQQSLVAWVTGVWPRSEEWVLTYAEPNPRERAGPALPGFSFGLPQSKMMQQMILRVLDSGVSGFGFRLLVPEIPVTLGGFLPFLSLTLGIIVFYLFGYFEGRLHYSQKLPTTTKTTPLTLLRCLKHVCFSFLLALKSMILGHFRHA